MIYMHSGEQKRQNGPENQMISELCLENRKYFQTACDSSAVITRSNIVRYYIDNYGH